AKASANGNSFDIYGRVPPKEPRYNFQCSACARSVSVLRYAPHLDKCLGKNKSGRSAGSQRKSANGISGYGNGTDSKDPVAAAVAASAASALIKKKKRKRNFNSHPDVASYIFPVGPIVLRLRVDADGRAVRVLSPHEIAVVGLITAPSVPALGEEKKPPKAMTTKKQQQEKNVKKSKGKEEFSRGLIPKEIDVIPSPAPMSAAVLPQAGASRDPPFRIDQGQSHSCPPQYVQRSPSIVQTQYMSSQGRNTAEHLNGNFSSIFNGQGQQEARH
ncbi:hypothetical protein NGA_2025900, partial [Nannochloropsis gaditana CCMP526]